MKERLANRIMIGICLLILLFLMITVGINIIQYRINNTYDMWEPIDWEERYPFSETGNKRDEELVLETEQSLAFMLHDMLQNFDGTIKQKERNLNTYINNMLPGYYLWVSFIKKYQSIVGFSGNSMIDSKDESQVIYMNNGHFTNVSQKIEETDIYEIADSTAEFNEYVRKKDIDFYYINLGSKVCPYDRQISIQNCEFTNENGTALMNALRERKISTVDIRDFMIEDKLDWYNAYYITDMHWKTETGLWAAGRISRILNENSGYEFDEKYFEKSSYNMESYDDFWVGNYGRAVTLADASLESYTKITPKFDTDISLVIPSKEINCRGSYEEVMINQDLLDEIANYSPIDHMFNRDAYGAISLDNYPLMQITNHSAENNADKKILVIYDSFGWYLASYLACDVGAVDIINMSNFTGSIRSYINENRPDTIVMMLCERNISAIDWNSHSSAFDFR